MEIVEAIGQPAAFTFLYFTIGLYLKKRHKLLPDFDCVTASCQQFPLSLFLSRLSSLFSAWIQLNNA